MSKRLVALLFTLLCFAVPLVVVTKTSEAFEFNKLILVYTTTVVVFGLWVVESIRQGKMLFRKTPLDIPLLAWIATQAISTIFTIDRYTSLFGYYGRFHGGLLSTIAFAILYWVGVSVLDKRSAKSLTIATITASVLVAAYAVSQHFGIDKSVWSQNVQDRVFATLGQPNWLAAWLVALTPLLWTRIAKSQTRGAVWISIYTLFCLAILYTQSRSGIIGFAAAYIVFWGAALTLHKGSHVKPFLVATLIPIILWVTIGVPRIQEKSLAQDAQDPASTIETRKLVWAGAIQIWETHPLTGTGVETFAFTYPGVRPIAHNSLTEWDYIYNKAHNEYLNYLANTGLLGLAAYLLVVSTTIQIIRHDTALLAGYVSVMVTNFFGFSVTPISLLLILFPILSVVRRTKNTNAPAIRTPHRPSLLYALPTLLTLYLLHSIYIYYTADLAYAKGQRQYVSGQTQSAIEQFTTATNLTPLNPIFYAEKATALARLAVDTNDTELASQAISAIDDAQILSSAKQTQIARERANVFIMLGEMDPQMYAYAKQALLAALDLAPTDPRLWYNLGLVYLQTDDTPKALAAIKHTVDIKPDYQPGLDALAYLKSQN